MGKIKDILFNDASQEGYEAGKKRALEGKDKSPFRTVTETDLKTKAKFAVQGDPAIDSWNKSYNDAYETTERAENVIEVSQTQPIITETINNKFKNTEKMARNNDFRVERQIELLKQLEASLNKTKEIVIGTVAKYKRTYDSLGNTMLQDTVKEFSENYERTLRNVATLVKQIDEIDIPYIKKEIDWWQNRR
jgi:hypothetical protein